MTDSTATDHVLERPQLDRSLVHGLAWSGATKWAGQILLWLCTIVVARLLTPGDYGLVGMATVYLGIATIIAEFGIGTAVVMLRDLPDRQIAQLNTLAVALGATALAVSLGAAIPLANFFGAPELRPVVMVMSAIFPIAALRVVPMALLQRELRFKELALAEGAQALLVAATMITLAALGFRYWTLVVGAVLGTTIWTLAVLFLKRHPFARPELDALGPAITFSRHILFSRVTWYIYSNGDFFVAGKLLGQQALGAYTFGWTLASIPVERVTALVVNVTPSFFSAVQTQGAALRRYLLALTEGLSIVTLPAAIGLALVADPLVPVLLGEHWAGAIRPLQILGFYAGIRSVMPLLTPILNATGHARFAMWVNVSMAVVLPLGFVAGARWGTTGIALAWLVLHPLLTVPLYWRVFDVIDLRVMAYLRALWPAASGSLVMAAVVLALKAGMGVAGSSTLRLAALIAAGALAYGAMLFIVHRARVASFVRLIRQLRRGEGPIDGVSPDPKLPSPL